MKKLLSLLFTLIVISDVLFGQAALTHSGDGTSTPTYTYYPLFSKEWIWNKKFQTVLEYPTVLGIDQNKTSLDGWDSYDFACYQNTTNFNFSFPPISTTRKEDAEQALRCELFGFFVEADRVALNINDNNREATGFLFFSLHNLTAYEDLENHLNLNWNSTSSVYSVSPSHDELQKIYTLLGQCEEDKLSMLVTAAQFTTDESTQYNAFRALQSKINPKDSITLSQFRFTSLEYINVLLARRVSIASGTAGTDGFEALNQYLLNLDLSFPDESSMYNAEAVNCYTLSVNAKCEMMKYESNAAPAIEWNL